MRLLRDLSASAVVAGFVTVLVGYTSSAVIVFQAARACGAGPARDRLLDVGARAGHGLTCIGLSLRYRVPVVTAWSTPGAALLATSAAGLPMSAAIGAFLACGALLLLFGVTGWFERGMSRIPMPIASGMLAGVLLRFGLDTFVAMRTSSGLALAMLAAYLVGRRLWPRYAVVGRARGRHARRRARGLLGLSGVRLELTRPVLTAPTFSASALSASRSRSSSSRWPRRTSRAWP